MEEARCCAILDEAIEELRGSVVMVHMSFSLLLTMTAQPPTRA